MPTPKLVSPTGRDIVLKPTRPNAGLEAAYRKQLDKLIDEMNASLLYWLSAAYKANEPHAARMAVDASPAKAMRDAMNKVARRWLRNFEKGADNLAKMFADKARLYSDVALARVLKEAGFSVEFKMTAGMNDAYQAVIGEQVGLIKSIASQHLTRVETLVMQSVQNGRDLATLSEQLQKQFGSTKKRAALIAKDQNNKATATLIKARQTSIGLVQARWRHSAAGKEPRESHVKASQADGGRGQLYNIAEGCYIDGKYIQPGEEINCRCTAQPVIPGFSE